MQVRGVPDEERAIGPDGRRLPFAIMTAADLRRRNLEDTGSFGKRPRRGLSRSKTATPAKREDPNLDAFAEALATDYQRRLEDDERGPSSQAPGGPVSLSMKDASTGITAVPTHKEPTEVLLYGFKSSMQYAAIEKYERISGGRICEDYEREAPSEHRKYQTISAHFPSRPLTNEEKRKVNRYAGGDTWIKVTYDSAEAAHRAVKESPQGINGYWVFAEIFQGVGPREDKALPVTSSNTEPRGLGRARHRFNQAPKLSSSTSTSALPLQDEPSRALPPMTSIQEDSPSHSSTTTASSATIVAANDEVPTQRKPFLSRSQSFHDSTSTLQQQTSSSEFCSRVPMARRAILRPADEAFLPSQSTSRWLASFLPPGLVGGQIIGHQLPRLEDGRFDYSGASLYWQVWYWIDWIFRLGSMGPSDD